jgi:hypothetical protein
MALGDYSSANIAGSAMIGGLFPHPTTVFTVSPPLMLHHAEVEKAENGFILRVVHHAGEQPKIYIAATTEELQKVFIAAIVAERVSK